MCNDMWLCTVCHIPTAHDHNGTFQERPEPRFIRSPKRGSYGSKRGSYGSKRGSYGSKRGSYGSKKGSVPFKQQPKVTTVLKTHTNTHTRM